MCSAVTRSAARIDFGRASSSPTRVSTQHLLDGVLTVQPVDAGQQVDDGMVAHQVKENVRIANWRSASR